MICVCWFCLPAGDIFTHRVIEAEREVCLFMEGRCLSVIHLTDNPTGNLVYFYLLPLSCASSVCFRGSTVSPAAAGKRPDFKAQVLRSNCFQSSLSVPVCFNRSLLVIILNLKVRVKAVDGLKEVRYTLITTPVTTCFCQH